MTGKSVKISAGSNEVDLEVSRETLAFFPFFDLPLVSAGSATVSSPAEASKSYSRWSSWKAILVASSLKICGLRNSFVRNSSPS